MEIKIHSPPSSGEWRAIGGYEPQYSLAAEFALRAAKERVLREVRLIDPDADLADDFQIVIDGRIDAYQVKWERSPGRFSFGNLMDLIEGLSLGRTQLQQLSPDQRVMIHVLTNCSLSTDDKIKDATGKKV